MSEPIIEQIAQWISSALDTKQDPDGTITFRAVRSKILNVQDLELVHGDVLIEFANKKTQSVTGSSRYELGSFNITGYIDTIPDDSFADTYLIKVAESICKLIHSGNTSGTACGGLASNINCPGYILMDSAGGVDVIINCEVKYSTNYKDGYSQ